MQSTLFIVDAIAFTVDIAKSTSAVYLAFDSETERKSASADIDPFILVMTVTEVVTVEDASCISIILAVTTIAYEEDDNPAGKEVCIYARSVAVLNIIAGPNGDNLYS